ncbi:MAG: hypothetical protein JWN52_2692, partial [Actinomycetia bacterium]|nr:hypothetical protein [Actinomycetes bacterium]
MSGSCFALGRCGAALVLLLPAHPHPSGSVDRVTPAAVRIEVTAQVDITLVGDRRYSRSYAVPLGAGSGFTVAPDGVVATATQVVRPDSDPRVYAANRIVAEVYGATIPADFARHVDDRLQSCYPSQRVASTCVTQVTQTITVFPYLDPTSAAGLTAKILKMGSTPAAPTILKITKGAEAETLPTVPLAAAVPGGLESVDVVGFSGRPGNTQAPVVETAHFDPPGTRTFKRSEAGKLTALLGQGGAGGPVIDDAKSEVIGLLSGGSEPTLTSAEDIRKALGEVSLQPRRGPVDVV